MEQADAPPIQEQEWRPPRSGLPLILTCQSISDNIPRMNGVHFSASFLIAISLQTLSVQAETPPERLEFTRMIAHLANYSDPDYLTFIDEVSPDLVQHGFYGAHFWSLAHTPQYAGYPAHFPLQGLEQCGTWFESRNAALHQRHVKVVGHFNVEFLVGEPAGPEGPRGFFKFYRDLWDEKELGPKPVVDPLEFLEKDAEGHPIVQQAYRIGGMHEYFACLRNPAWQQVLRAWMKRGVERGVDGFIANYFYRHNCLCRHCQSGFKAYLKERFNPGQLKSRFGIVDLEKHRFPEIVCWHKPEETTPLRQEMLRWSQLSNKQIFDDLFIHYGQSLKPGLLAAQWNHLGDFHEISGDERCFLPAEVWGRDEDYLWYSTGSSACQTDLKNGFFGDATLQARFIRGAFDDKPFTLGKYESVRTRTAIAELAANGGAPMGLYARFENPAAREIYRQYYPFLKRYEALYRANHPHAEVKLLFPRKALHRGDTGPLQTFRDSGKAWLDRHLLFSVEPDDLTPGLGGYYDTIPDEAGRRFSTFTAPAHVRISANRPDGGGEIDLHFVNYNREELPPTKAGKPNPGKGPEDEKPIPVSGITVDFAVPPNFVPGRIEFISPEQSEPLELAFQLRDGRLAFALPEFLVYGVARMIAAPPEKPLQVAGLTTVFHRNSHAEMFLGRLLETDTLDGKGDRVALHLASLFTDQVPANDISRALAAVTPGLQVGKTVRDALTRGTGKLAVDGVFLVAEHGDYPETSTGQIAYPKRRFFEELFRVFDESGKVVPVFSDKHLADNWIDTQWIHEEAKKRGIPLMAGSSVPGTWRFPAADLPRGAKVREIVGVNYGRLDAYGFHALEAVQSLAERRAGGETGVRAVRCLSGEDVWEAGRKGLYDPLLLDAVTAAFRERPLKPGETLAGLARQNPTLFHIEYTDGLRVSLLTVPGAVAEWAAAWRQEDGSVQATTFATQELRPYFHFAHLLHNITGFMRTGQAPWPVERTVLTTGLLDALLTSRRDGGKELETPWLGRISYQTTWDWHQPPPPPPGRNIGNP